MVMQNGYGAIGVSADDLRLPVGVDQPAIDEMVGGFLAYTRRAGQRSYRAPGAGATSHHAGSPTSARPQARPGARGLRRVTVTPSSMAATPPRRLPAGARSQHSFAPCALWPAPPRRRAERSRVITHCHASAAGLFRCRFELGCSEHEVHAVSVLVALEAIIEIDPLVYPSVSQERLIFSFAVAFARRVFAAPAGPLLHHSEGLEFCLDEAPILIFHRIAASVELYVIASQCDHRSAGKRFIIAYGRKSGWRRRILEIPLHPTGRGRRTSRRWRNVLGTSPCRPRPPARS
jgi:hypothetical protein